jgi:LacI family gluconate utilization system Gnt-I transcriptional repressor
MDTGADPVDMMVGFSHFAAGAVAAEHLMKVGYRRIGFIGARMDPRSTRRMAGFRAALAAAGIDDEALIATTKTPSSILLGRKMFADLFDRAPDVDAVFCNNDDLAIGVLFECLHRQLPIPGRIGIVGFNDLEIVSAAVPSLTSIRTPRYEIGRRAADLILLRLAGENPKPPTIDLGFELLARESTNRSHR